MNAIKGGNDIADIILSSIPIGTAFADAEAILREAGFKVDPRPGANGTGGRPDRFDIIASISQYVQHYFNRVNLYFSIIPESPGNYIYVHNILAGFIQNHL